MLTLDSVAADEGYRLTYGGYDFLACRTFAKRNTIYSVGNQIGTGKESGKSAGLLLASSVGATVRDCVELCGGG